MRRCALILVAVAAACLTGCDKQSDNLPPQGSVRVLHAVPDLWQALVRVRSSATGAPDLDLGTVEYGGSSSVLGLAEDSYPFTIRVREPGSASNPIGLEFTQTIGGDRGYVLVLVGDAANLQLLEWERGAPSGGSYGHAGPALGAVDVYVEAPGADLLAATPRASLDFGDYLPNVALGAGEYQLSVTTQGDPADVLYQSAAFDVGSGATPTFVLLEAAGTGPGTVLVRVLGLGALGFLEDASTPPQLRAAHSALDAGNVDIVVDNQFMTPLIADLAFQSVSPYTPTTADEVDLTVTEAGNQGVLLLEEMLDLVSGSFASVFLVGTLAEPEIVVTADGRRRVAGFAQFRFAHGASNFDLVDIYVVSTGEDFTRFAPLRRGVAFRGVTAPIFLNPGTYDVVLTRNGGNTALARADGLVLDALGLYSLLATDAVDPDTAEVVLYDDFAP